MMTLIARLVLAFLLLTLTAERLYGQNTLVAARELYASAQYDDALKVLEGLSTATTVGDARQSIDLYRALCLLALGRRDEADGTIEAMISRDPLYRPGDEISPRTRSAFSDARKRMLPAIVQQQYGEAKHAFDRKEFQTAAAMFGRVIAALDDPEIAPIAQQPPLSDVRTLALGFYELTMKAMAPPPAPPPPTAAPEPPPPAYVPPRIYTAEDAGVQLPVAISQQLPRYPSVVPPGGLKGTVEVVINEQGLVDSAAMTVPIRSIEPARVAAVVASYDKMVLTAASKWQFQPASVNGVPVKFRKRVQINISPAQ